MNTGETVWFYDREKKKVCCGKIEGGNEGVFILSYVNDEGATENLVVFRPEDDKVIYGASKLDVLGRALTEYADHIYRAYESLNALLAEGRTLIALKEEEERELESLLPSA